ncbi:MAG: MFS transporter [Acetivibrionales bacterium]|jgi:FHS family glucose/mannose:H+ symporter-like MFS transporter
MNRKKAYIAVCYACFLAGGIGITMEGSLLPYLIAEYQLNYESAGSILSIRSFGIMIACFFSGYIAEKIGKTPALTLGLFLFGLGLSSLLFASQTLTLQIFGAVAGIGYGIMNNMGNSLVNDISNGSNVAINLLHMSYSLGCFFVPLIVQLSLRFSLTWRLPVIIFVILAGAILFIILFSPFRKLAEGKNPEHRSNYGFLKKPHYYVLLLTLLLSTGFQNGIIGWLVTYLQDSGTVDSMDAQKLFSFMLLSMIIGRLLSAMMSKRMKTEVLLLICCVFPVLALSCIAISSNQTVLTILLVLCGISFAGQYPLVVSCAKEILFNNPNASGILFALSGLGGTLVTYLCGWGAEQFGVRAILYIILLFGILLLGMALVNAIITRRNYTAT